MIRIYFQRGAEWVRSFRVESGRVGDFGYEPQRAKNPQGLKDRCQFEVFPRKMLYPVRVELKQVQRIEGFRCQKHQKEIHTERNLESQ